MSKYDDFEKKIIHELISQSENTDEVFPMNVLDRFDFFNNAQWDGPNHRFVFEVDINLIQDGLFYYGVVDKLKKAIQLFKDLENDGYITRNPPIPTFAQQFGLEQISNANALSISIRQDLNQDIFSCVNSSACVKESLRQLERNDFKTADELALDVAKEQNKLGRRSFWVSIVALLVSSISTIISYCSSRDATTIKFESNQFKAFESISPTLQRIDSTAKRNVPVVLDSIGSISKSIQSVKKDTITIKNMPRFPRPCRTSNNK